VAIDRTATQLQADLPKHAAFTAIRPALALDYVARLQWPATPPNGPADATGTDIAVSKTDKSGTFSYVLTSRGPDP
jgi:hypothetical protein